MKRVLKYIKVTRHMKLALIVDSMSLLRWWVDESLKTQEYYKGHSVSMIYLVKGVVVSSSRKKKLNGRSSTESELVRTDEFFQY